MARDKKLNSVLGQHYGFYNDGVERKYILYWALSLRYSVQYGIYFLPTSRHYKAVMSSQCRI